MEGIKNLRKVQKRYHKHNEFCLRNTQQSPGAVPAPVPTLSSVPQNPRKYDWLAGWLAREGSNPSDDLLRSRGRWEAGVGLCTRDWPEPRSILFSPSHAVTPALGTPTKCYGRLNTLSSPNPHNNYTILARLVVLYFTAAQKNFM